MMLPPQVQPIKRTYSRVSKRLNQGLQTQSAPVPVPHACSDFVCDTDQDCPANCVCDGFGRCEDSPVPNHVHSHP